MTKTLQIWHDYKVDKTDKKYKVVIQGWDETFYVNSYTLDVGDREVLLEDGCQTVNIENYMYFHVDVDEDRPHITISVENEEQQGETYLIPYKDSYTIHEKISEVGIPNTEAAREKFLFTPQISLEVEWSPPMDELSCTGVKIGSEMYDIEKR